MGPGVVVSSTREASPLVGMLGGLLYGPGGVMLIVIYSVTGCVDRPASLGSLKVLLFGHLLGYLLGYLFDKENKKESYK